MFVFKEEPKAHLSQQNSLQKKTWADPKPPNPIVPRKFAVFSCRLSVSNSASATLNPIDLRGVELKHFDLGPGFKNSLVHKRV